ncbi:hypothetical protein RB601_003642 [Gaeumannomyces tritici]
MQFFSASILLALAAGAVADFHYAAVCVTGRTAPNDGQRYEIFGNATRCACDHYKNRNTGNKKWDKCPNCKFDGLQCNSGDWHIGSDEWEYYCNKECGGYAAEASH